MLRASNLSNDGNGNIVAASDSSSVQDCDVPAAAELLAFADAVIGRDESGIEVARSQLLQSVGPVGLVDAAAVIGNFERMNRIADATGIDLDGPLQFLSASIRDELSLNTLASADRAKPAGFLLRWIARWFLPVAARFYSAKKRTLPGSVERQTGKGL